MHRLSLGAIAALFTVTACGGGGEQSETFASADSSEASTGSESDSSDESADESADEETTSDTGESEESGEDGGAKFDVASGDVPDDPEPTCSVPEDDLDAIPPCEDKQPAENFEPSVKWSWEGDGDSRNSITTPLVANLTDDNDDGVIDLCDTPDVLVATNVGLNNAPMTLHLLDGATGDVHWSYDGQVMFSQVPAIGDIDDDGEPEIVAVSSNGSVFALEPDGSLAWQQQVGSWTTSRRAAVALADLDNDGDVEIIVGNGVLDHEGNTLWNNGEPLNFYHTVTAADLDDDGDLEVVMGRSAWHHDGTVHYLNQGLAEGHAHVADLDDDGEPEVLTTAPTGVSLMEADGTIVWSNLTPSGDPPAGNNWRRPAAIHDIDGDADPEFLVSSSANYGAYHGADATVLWLSPVADLTGAAAGTAFDFLGDGEAEAMYGDEQKLFIFDEEGNVLLENPRGSRTTNEFPVVADVDNDGSAEIVVVSESDYQNGAATVQVIGEAEGRWIQARRIWNQHAYHVTNVREDGTIPQFETPSWEGLNTFRTQAQIEGGVCKPEPEG